MADGLDLGALMTRREKALATLDDWLKATAARVSRLGPEARLYPKRKVKDGWRVPISFPSGERRFDVLIGDAFPFDPPRISLVDRPPHLTWPHIEADGYLCLLPAGAAVSFKDPVAVLTCLLDEAVRLVEASEVGANRDDFRAEFLSYWQADENAPKVRSLLQPHGPSRAIMVYRFKGLYIVAETEAALTTWLDHALAQSEKAKDVDPALLIWLDQPMLPSEYPASSADVLRQVRAAGLGADLDRLAAEQLQRIVVVLGAPTPNGPAFAAVVLQSSGRDRNGPRPNGGIERGFRPGRTPPAVIAQRFLGSTRPSKAEVERVDAAWIHGRDGDPDLARLRAAKVVIAGCGSLGGPVAIGLAQAGVGSLDLIDPQTLRSANIGRHPLGVSKIGMSKAETLAARIRRDYPHARHVRGVLDGWEDVAAREPQTLLESDLVISTIGDWAPEAALNAWLQSSVERPNSLFGWTEPHAVAGHAIGLVGGAGCLACGLTDWGEPLSPVAAWPDGAGRRGEPACGVMYQPYGPVELTHVVALITEAALDILLHRVTTSFHRVWIARETVLERAGAVWSEAWKAANAGAPKGARLEERDWPRRSSCLICGARVE